MHHYKGSCHCGAIRFEYRGEAIERGLRCNCSICIRKGALMTSEAIPSDHISIQADDDALGLYQFGNEVAKHYFCKHCGIYPFHETVRKPGHYRVNIGCLDEVDPLTLQFEIFDGKHAL